MTNAERGVSKAKKRLSPDEVRIKKLENDVKNMKEQITKINTKVKRLSLST